MDVGGQVIGDVGFFGPLDFPRGWGSIVRIASPPLTARFTKGRVSLWILDPAPLGMLALVLRLLSMTFGFKSTSLCYFLYICTRVEGLSYV